VKQRGTGRKGREITFTKKISGRHYGMRSVTSQINEYDDDDDGGGYGLVNEIHKC